MLSLFRIPSLMIVYVFCLTFSSIDSALIVHRFRDGFWYHVWCLFDTFSVRAGNLLNLLNVITIQKNKIWFPWSFSLPVLALIFDEFRYLFWFHFGNSLASNSMFWGDSLFDELLINLYQLLIKNNSKKRRWNIISASLFDSVPQVVFLKVPWLRLSSLLAPF